MYARPAHFDLPCADQLTQSTASHAVLCLAQGHASIIGNEKADAIAKAAATGDTSDYEECEKYESPSNNRLTQYWPHKTQWNKRWSRTNGQRTLIDRFKRVNPLTDLHDSVRHYCHQKSRFGMANRATCYFEAFKRIEDRLDLPASNEYMTSGKIKYAERKTALRYRYGNVSCAVTRMADTTQPQDAQL